MANGHQLGTGADLRRMPPPAGGVLLRWERTPSGLHVEGTVAFAPADPPERRRSVGPADRSAAQAPVNRRLLQRFRGRPRPRAERHPDPTGETLADVQARVLGDALSAPLFSETHGFVVFGARAAWPIRPNAQLVLIGENPTDRNYRLHGSDVDAPGFNLQIRTRVRF